MMIGVSNKAGEADFRELGGESGRLLDQEFNLTSNLTLKNSSYFPENSSGSLWICGTQPSEALGKVENQ